MPKENKSQVKVTGEKPSEVKLLLTGKIGRLYKDMIPALRRFPKTQKYTLAQMIENELLSSVKLILGATYQREGRIQRLNDVRLNFHTLAFLLRTSQETDCISMGLYEQFSREIDEMGRMSSSWIKAETKKDFSPAKSKFESKRMVPETLSL